jgi:hypothetical protein
MIFGKSAKIDEEENQQSMQLEILHAPMVPIGTNTVSKVQVAAPESKGDQRKRGGKIFNDTHPQYPPPQKRWKPKAVEVNQSTTKIEDKTTAGQLSAGTTDNLAAKVRPSSFIPDHLTLESGPSVPHHNASNDAPTPMEEDNTEEDDLLGEELVHYGASPEHQGMDVNVIMFSTDCAIIGDDELVVAQLDFGLKEVAFTKPKESVNHLKPLFVRGHIDVIPIAKCW